MNAPALFSFLRSVLCFVTLVLGANPGLPAAEPGPPAFKTPEIAPPEVATNAPAEFHLTPQLIEQIRRELEQNSARNAEAITSSLNLLEPALSRMQQRQAEALEGANRIILVFAGLFAVIGFLALIIITLILMRALGRFPPLATAGPPAHRDFGAGPAHTALEPSVPATPDNTVEQSSARFQGALEQLQRRIFELEHGLQGSSADTWKGPLPNPPRALPAQSNGTLASVPPSTPSTPVPPAAEPNRGSPVPESEPASRAAVLLGKGQTLLNLGAAQEALVCFEQALALQTNSPEAFIKRGLALEQLENWEEALASYDRALHLDGSLTVAYLYKGGVCNRLQRYQEALASYEQALHTERKTRAP